MLMQNFWGDKQRALWYVMVFSIVANYKRLHISAAGFKQ